MTDVPALIGLLLSPLVGHGLLSRRDASVFVHAGGGQRFEPLDSALRDAANALMPGSLRLHVSSVPTASADGVLVCAHVFIHDGSAERDVAAAYRDAHGEDSVVRLTGSRRSLAPSGAAGSCGPELAWVLDPDSSLLVTALKIPGAAGDPARPEG